MRLVKDLAVVGTSALLTALVAGPFVVPAPASAGPEEEARLIRAFLDPRPFDASGVGLTMEFDPETCRPGEKLAATLSAVNRNDATAERKLRIVMHVTPRTSPMARMIRVPKQAWTTEVTLRLAAGETKTVAIRPEIAVQEGETVTFSAEADGRGGLIARYPAAAAQGGAPTIHLLPLAKEPS
jgi:hypothetical protein